MNLTQHLSRSIAVLQGMMLLVLGAIYFAILPAYGFTSLEDFNDPTRMTATRLLMLTINWIHVLFGLTMLGLVYVLDRYMRARWSFVARSAVTVILFGGVVWLLLHDVGFQIINWPDIERDPAGTNYAMDTLLWGIRNSIFFVLSLLVALGFHIDQNTRSTRHSTSGD
jgi:MFS superfamily sulfate permease-like transporter